MWSSKGAGIELLVSVKYILLFTSNYLNIKVSAVHVRHYTFWVTLKSKTNDKIYISIFVIPIFTGMRSYHELLQSVPGWVFWRSTPRQSFRYRMLTGSVLCTPTGVKWRWRKQHGKREKSRYDAGPRAGLSDPTESSGAKMARIDSLLLL